MPRVPSNSRTQVAGCLSAMWPSADTMIATSFTAMIGWAVPSICNGSMRQSSSTFGAAGFSVAPISPASASMVGCS